LGAGGGDVGEDLEELLLDGLEVGLSVEVLHVGHGKMQLVVGAVV
jgi:hypothetical protein